MARLACFSRASNLSTVAALKKPFATSAGWRTRILKRVLKGIEECRDTWRPRIQGTIIYSLLKVPSRFLRRVLPNYRHVAKDGIFYRESELWMCSLQPTEILEWVMQQVRPKTVLDLGCGTGKSVDWFLDRGIDALGIEGSKLAISKAKNPHRILQWNLQEELQLNRKFDLVFSYEVVEHIHADYVRALVRSFVNHADLLVMTAARPGQGGEGHLNEQPPEYWIAQFANHGYRLDERMTAAIKATGESHSQNALVFRRQSITAAAP